MNICQFKNLNFCAKIRIFKKVKLLNYLNFRAIIRIFKKVKLLNYLNLREKNLDFDFRNSAKIHNFDPNSINGQKIEFCPGVM